MIKGVAALNVYKKVAIIRTSTDVLSYEDADGNVKTITDLHLAAAATTPLHTAKPKHDIPVPKIKTVESYQADIPPNYHCPKSYVRYQRPTIEELKENLEYVVDAEDEVWLLNHAKFGGASSSSSSSSATNNYGQESKKRTADGYPKGGTVQLPIGMLETMIDVMEKATAFDTIITIDQAESLITKKLPQLYHMYPIKARAGVVTLKHVLTDVYNYWVSKRSKLKRPLLRRFWPVTSSDDTNPHLVFRPREKEKYKLRKKRQNDMDAYKKLQQLKQDFQQLKSIMELVKQREELNQSLIVLQNEWFKQKLYDAVDTSGLPRISQALQKDKLASLVTVENYFDFQEGRKKSKKSRRGSQTGKSSRSTTPVPDSSGAAKVSGDGAMAPDTTHPAPPLIIAGQNNGEPAPNFMHPLSTREHYTTSWENAEPHVTTFVDSHPLPTFRFRHRPRVGRGGRLCIDRMPLPIDPRFTPTTFFRAGNCQIHPNKPKQRLLDLLPTPLDTNLVRQRIEEVCLGALREEYETPPPPTTGASALGIEADDNDGDAVIVKVNDWLNTDEQQWGEERYSIGPL